jgi:hypothetical protein
MGAQLVDRCRNSDKLIRKGPTGGASRLGRAAFAMAGAMVALVASSPEAAAQSGKLESAYVVLGGQGAIARAIFSGTTECPTIDLGGAAERMSVRANPDIGDKPAFPVLVCETLIPPRTASAAIGARKLPLPASRSSPRLPCSATPAAGSRPRMTNSSTMMTIPAASRTATARRSGRSRG